MQEPLSRRRQWLTSVVAISIHPIYLHMALILPRRWDIQLSESATAVEGSGEALPEIASMDQNYPNPFNASTVIRFSIPVTGKVSVTIYNLLGQGIRKLGDERLEAGVRSLRWDGRNDVGQHVSSGVYLCRLQSAKEPMARKLLLLK